MEVCRDLTWFAADGDGHVRVTWIEDHEGRQVYGYALFIEGDRVAAGMDLRSGVGDAIDARKAMELLCSFIDAFNEAQSYPNSENRSLFPESAVPWAEKYAEEFVMAFTEGEE